MDTSTQILNRFLKDMIIDIIVDKINKAVQLGATPTHVFINKEQERALHFFEKEDPRMFEKAGNGCIDTIMITTSSQVKVVVVDEIVWSIEVAIKL